MFSGGWDKTLRQWDQRTAAAVCVTDLPDKAFALAVSSQYVVVGTAGRHVILYDIRNMETPLQVAARPSTRAFTLG